MKSAYLQELEDQQLYGSKIAPPGGFALPFVLVQTHSHAEVEIEMSENTQLVHFDFNGTPFELHYDNYVLKEMKLCGRSKGGDDMAKGGSVDDMAIGGTTIPSNRPPLPGKLKARGKREH
ncbi:unnamed protein product [Lactuca virosa]|uniref:Transcription factor DP C-terminal domain-containing protein n=1 Tax=Lactuca virosa TaxID=75947 RepID=A0AAU9P0A0_9ASTR|nr:unnamed protein product [Lactuca virosa]